MSILRFQNTFFPEDDLQIIPGLTNLEAALIKPKNIKVVSAGLSGPLNKNVGRW